jgi:uncharacterized membrane protein (UPF0127 family)
MGSGGAQKAGVSLLLALLAGIAQAGCAPDRVTVQGDWGHASFRVAVADDADERAQGLMNVPELPVMAGMLFVYDQPTHATFWMRNTLIPLDMLFVDATGRILVIHPDAVPLDDTTIDGGQGVQAVLEINGGMAARLGIQPGDLLQHPAFGPGAALPCAG